MIDQKIDPATLTGKFSERLYQARRALGLTQAQLCREVWGDSTSKHRDRMSAYEAGRYSPTRDKLDDLAGYFGLPIEVLAPDLVGTSAVTGEVTNTVRNKARNHWVHRSGDDDDNMDKPRVPYLLSQAGSAPGMSQLQVYQTLPTVLALEIIKLLDTLGQEDGERAKLAAEAAANAAAAVLASDLSDPEQITRMKMTIRDLG